MNDRQFRLIGIPLLSVVIAALTVPASQLSRWPDLAVNLLISLYFCTFLWLGNRWLWGWLLRRLPLVSQTRTRLWVLAGLSVVYTTVATLLLRLPLHALLPQFFSLQWRAQLAAVTFNLIPTAVVQTLYEAIYFFQQWTANVRRTEQLQSAGVRSQLEALQQQLDPHFLFNSLNTLSALIEPHNEPAQQFVERLADVYRYVLLARSTPTVPLEEELAFVDTYLALHKARFRHNLHVHVDVPPAALTRHVAPLSVQLLVENALKHNVASQQHPLELRLRADATGQQLVVENTLRPRTAGLAPGTGTGLLNIRHRYELLRAPAPVQVTTEAGWFRVQLPLLGA